MAEQNKVVIQVYGKEYSITSSENPEITQEYAAFIDSVMRGIGKKTSLTDQNRVAMLALLQITHDLFQARNKSKSASLEYDRKMEEIIGEIETAINEEAIRPS